MEELSPEQLDEILRAPQPKTRKKKKFERNVHTWFYDLVTIQGQCDNPNCEDPRTRGANSKRLVYVWEHESGVCMCRHCFFSGWEPNVES